MGSDSSEESRNRSPEHEVYLDGYWIDKYEVNNGQYRKCVDVGECEPPGDFQKYSNTNYIKHPVVEVSWYDAQAYCQWAGRRLPTEAEWEKAARGIDNRIYPWGNEIPTDNLTNNSNNVGNTTEVGSYLGGASPYGAMDMAGNVWEWVADWYHDDYYSLSTIDNPQGPTNGEFRVLRGGSWYYDSNAIQTFFRVMERPDMSIYLIGFRCALSEASP